LFRIHVCLLVYIPSAGVGVGGRVDSIAVIRQRILGGVFFCPRIRADGHLSLGVRFCRRLCSIRVDGWPFSVTGRWTPRWRSSRPRVARVHDGLRNTAVRIDRWIRSTGIDGRG
jgi:hypothetical protein